MSTPVVTAVILAVILAVGLVWRYAYFCPSWLVPLLENPYVDAVAGAPLLLQRAGVRAGMHVLDAGCGPGRLTIPAAERVGAGGRVVALDIQPAMLARLAQRVAGRGLVNVTSLHAGLGDGKLPAGEFDIAFLVTVLGEVPDKVAALREIHGALRPGGVLSITEVLPDPHYQPIARVRALAQTAGFPGEGELFAGVVSYTLNVRKAAASA
jgi:ubiquinone/menaquinone biosynthesis C-methylase UbiE